MLSGVEVKTSNVVNNLNKKRYKFRITLGNFSFIN